MGISKRFCMLLAALLCLLFSVPARAMLPQPGIYEKTDGSGRVTARMFIISLHGKGYTMPGSLTMKTFFGSPIIALQARAGHHLHREDPDGRRRGNGPAPDHGPVARHAPDT